MQVGKCATLSRGMPASGREILLRRIVQELTADSRVAAAWLTGSIGRGEADSWSDFDLHVAIYDEHAAAFWNDRFALYERVGRLVLVQGEMPSNAQSGGNFQLVIFDGPLEVDWNVGPLSLARRSKWHVPLLSRSDVPSAARRHLSSDERRANCEERLLFLWAMAPIAIKYIARGQTHRAVCQIALISDAFISLWRLVETGDNASNGLNQPLEPALTDILPRFESTIDPLACLAIVRQLCDRTAELHSHLAELGVSIPEEMPAQLARLIAELRC
jgi:predicted nucleotidyltransferase